MLLTNIAHLLMTLPADCRRLSGRQMADMPVTVDNAWLQTAPDGTIAAYGTMDNCPDGDERFDTAGACVLPCFCDSHTHIIYAGSREGEWVDKIHGLSYQEVARRGGGILNSADRLAECPEDELFEQAMARARLMMDKGTGAMEIKTGYGLTTAAELKMLRVAQRMRRALPVPVKITFLGAHAVGRQYAGRQAEYVDMLIAEMLPAIAAEGIADFVDVFCDDGFFTPSETARILDAAAACGMKPKIHANELGVSGGVQVAVAAGALSADHLEQIGEEEIALLSDSGIVATMLPGASFFSNLPYAPARRAIDAGACVALASDYNPGSSPSGDMRMVWTLGCTQMRLDPTEALAACTINGAAAMGLGGICGSITPGKRADLIITRALPSPQYIPYAYTEPWIQKVMFAGRFYNI